MPNYCLNKIEINGDLSQLEELLAFVKSEDSAFDFNKICPLPPSIKNTERGSVAFASEAVCLYLAEKTVSNHLKWMMDKAEISAADLERVIKDWESQGKVDLALGYRIIENRKLYDGDGDWYEYCLRHWGTKWEACDPQVTDNVITFETAWSPAIPVLAKLANLFPELSISHKYFEPGVSLAGENFYNNGVCVASYIYDYCDSEYIKLGNEFGFEFSFND